MKRLGVALLVVVLQASAFGQGAKDDAGAGGEIRQQSERYFNAIDRRDVKALDDLLVEECLVCYPRGVVDTKASLLESLRKRGPADGPPHSKLALTDVKVRSVGETVVLTARLTTKRGDAPEMSNRRTLTWARQGDRWRVMHDQWALVGDAGEAEYWSEYFRGNNQNFNRKPSLLLTQAVEGVRPGKALDVGMGEGRNAINLAQRGWEVTGIDRAEGALALARQQARDQGVRLTPILQAAEEFDWGREQWDLIALLYFSAVRQHVSKVRESLKPGGLVVVEAFLASPGSAARGVEYKPGELRKLFEEGFKILRYEETEGVADYGQKPAQLVRLVASRTDVLASYNWSTSQPSEGPSLGRRLHARRIRRGR